MPDRIFTEDEVKAIIRRASARQEEEAERREAREHGLTLAELERLGTEVGLDPKHLRAAAGEVKTGRRTAVEAETKTNTHVIVERWIDGPFTPEGWEDTVALLRQRFGVGMGMWYGQSGEGRVEQVGRAHEWTHTSQLGIETRVSASEREGQARLILSQRVGQASSKVEGAAIGLFLSVIVGVLGSIAVADWLGSGFILSLLALTLVTALAAVPVVTRIERGWRDKKHRELRALAADIEQTFEAALPQTETAGPNDAPQQHAEPDGRLGLDALPESEEEDSQPSGRSRTRS